jgi:hypothetical protein
MSALLSLPISAIIIHNTLFSPDMRRFFDMHWSFAVGVTIPYVCCMLLACFLSLSATNFFLRRMLTAKSLSRIFSLADITLALIIGTIAFAFAYFTAQWFTDIFLRLLGWTIVAPTQKYLRNVVEVTGSIFTKGHFETWSAIMFVMSFIPSIVYIAITLIGVTLFVLEAPIRRCR